MRLLLAMTLAASPLHAMTCIGEDAGANVPPVVEIRSAIEDGQYARAFDFAVERGQIDEGDATRLGAELYDLYGTGVTSCTILSSSGSGDTFHREAVLFESPEGLLFAAIAAYRGTEGWQVLSVHLTTNYDSMLPHL